MSKKRKKQGRPYYEVWTSSGSGSGACIYCSLIENVDTDSGPAAKSHTKPSLANIYYRYNSLKFYQNAGGAFTQVSYPIVNLVDAGDDEIHVTGDYTANFAAGDHIRVSGSTSNDGKYEIKGVSFNGTETVFALEQVLTQFATIDGQVDVGVLKLTGEAGKYRIDHSWTLECNNMSIVVSIFINGALVPSGAAACHPPGAGDLTGASSHAIVDLEVNDEIDFRFKMPGGSNKDIWAHYATVTIEKV